MAEPILQSCTLTPAEQRSRHRLLRETLIPQVRRTIRVGNSLQLEIEQSATNRELLEEFIAFEKHCCDFLSYSLTDNGTHLTLTIQAPSESGDVIDTFHRLVEDARQ